MCSHGFLEGSWRPGQSLNQNDDLHDRSVFAVAAKQNWWFWRPIVYGVLSYTEADSMSMSDILEANAALDYKFKLESRKRV